MLIEFPSGLCPIGGGFAQSVKNIGGGQSLSGFEQVISGTSDRWQASFTFPLNRKERILALRGFIIGMSGRANSVPLPVFDLDRPAFVTSTPESIGTIYAATFYQQNENLIGTEFEYSQIEALSGTATVTAVDTVLLNVAGGAIENGIYVQGPSGDRRRLSSVLQVGAGAYAGKVTPHFVIPPGARTAPLAFLGAGAALNAIALQISLARGGPLLPGHLLSIGRRLYAATSVSGVNVGIWPPLRAAASEGDEVNLASPVCEMRFASDEEGAEALKRMDRLKFGSVTLNFEEAAVI